MICTHLILDVTLRLSGKRNEVSPGKGTPSPLPEPVDLYDNYKTYFCYVRINNTSFELVINTSS